MMQPHSLEDIFEQCLEALERGESLDQAVIAFPEHEQELRALLAVVQQSRRMSPAEPGRGALTRSRTKMLARAHELRSSPQSGLLNPLLRWAMITAVLLVFLLVGGFGLAAASAQALPGDNLYSVKRTAEMIQLNLTAGKSNRLSLNIRQDMQRLEEVRRLLQLRRVVEVQFEATLDTKNGALWQFEGIPVLVTQDTIVPSGLRVGDVLQVAGRTTTQGWFRADSVGAAGLTFDGRIEAIDRRQWVVAGRTLDILPLSTIEADLNLGDLVRVKARTENESLIALEIVAIEPAATPIATLIPSDSEQVSPTAAPKETEPEADEKEEDEKELESLGEFDLTGSLVAMELSRWRVGNRWLFFNDGTDFDGDFEIGDLIRVRGSILADGSYLANEIREIESSGDSEDDSKNNSDIDSEDDSEAEDSEDESDDELETNTPEPSASPTANPEPSPTEDSTEEPEDQDVEFEGTITSIEGNSWHIDGTTVIVTVETRLEGDPREGDDVRVEAEYKSDGKLYAERIEVD